MNWLTDLLKHLAISRSMTGAIFVTALVLYFGPRILPTFVEPVPKEWSPVVVGAMVFSGFLLLFWGIAATWKLLTRGAGAASKALAAIKLLPREQEILIVLGANPTKTLNLQNVNYTGTPFTELELIDLMHSLAKKGLVHLNQHDDSLISLTPAGRKRALELQRQMRSVNAT